MCVNPDLFLSGTGLDFAAEVEAMASNSESSFDFDGPSVEDAENLAWFWGREGTESFLKNGSYVCDASSMLT